METVYIIGNGFDLHHNLPTKYMCFHNFITVNSNELETIFEEYFSFRVDSHYLWTNFEEDLGSFNWRSFFDANNNIDTNDESFKRSYAYDLEDDLSEQAELLTIDIKNSFQNWIDSIDISIAEKKMKFVENSFFINFNYTLLLEEVYKISPDKILHIHGDSDNNSGELIFGHDAIMNTPPELDENGDSNRTFFTDSENVARVPFHNFYKPVNEIIMSNKKTFDSLSELKQIYVLGHSLNTIDIPYFKQINCYAKTAKWNVSYFSENEKDKHFLTLMELGILPSHIHLFKL